MHLALRGHVRQARDVTFDQLCQLPDAAQIADAQALGAKRPGRAVRLSAVLELCHPLPEADFLGLHASADDFHASVPLAPLLERAILIYAQDGQPLPSAAGGPCRLFIPDHAECHMSEIDECANVKFIDTMELTVGKGFDNRPEDDAEHEELHRRQEDDASAKKIQSDEAAS